VDDRTRQFLARERVAHLATADAGGAPHVVPVCFALVGDCLYIAIDEKPKKSRDLRQLKRLRNILENPRIALVTDVYDDSDWSRLGFVLVRATARICEAAEDREHALAVRTLREKYPQYRNMRLEERPLIAADVTAVTSWGRLEG
jgi:coenzyme F420-0:L-glutamate ligase/coenzyme F420-1:gamma-L-glutamate ligase